MLASAVRSKVLWLIALGAAIGCDSAAPPPAAANESPPSPARPAGDGLLAEGEAESVRAALQGTFEMSWWRGNGDRHPEVWSIAGDALTRWDGKVDEAAELMVVAPCLAKVEWPSGSFTYESFVIDGDTVWFGETGGRTQADRTVVCTSLGVWVLGPEGCKRWRPGGFSSHRSGLHPEDATCTRAANGDVTVDGTTWIRRGDVLVSASFVDRRPVAPVRHASLAAAKAAAQ